jgi:hypothetical protein
LLGPPRRRTYGAGRQERTIDERIETVPHDRTDHRPDPEQATLEVPDHLPAPLATRAPIVHVITTPPRKGGVRRSRPRTASPFGLREGSCPLTWIR